jgi:hypothetical protein
MSNWEQVPELCHALHRAVESTVYRILAQSTEHGDSSSDIRAEDKAWKEVVAVLSSYSEQERKVS